MPHHINIDQASLDEWNDDGGAILDALEPLGIDAAVVTGTDGIRRLVTSEELHEQDSTDSERS